MAFSAHHFIYLFINNFIWSVILSIPGHKHSPTASGYILEPSYLIKTYIGAMVCFYGVMETHVSIETMHELQKI